MNFQDCITFAQEHPFCFLATVDGDQPRVRSSLAVIADETGFYFETFPGKHMSNQMHANPKVEICFFNGSNDLMEAKHMRVTGAVEFLDDPVILDRVYEKIKGLEPLAGGPFKHMLEIYCLRKGDIHFWTINDLGKEADIEHLKF
jgi:uncharacterized pyridoxamine 5'-phosphate oxidase family protein